MKSLILIVSLIASSAFAQEILPSRIVAQLSAVDFTIKSIKLNEAGILSVVTNNDQVMTEQLSESNYRDLQYNVQALAGAKIKTDFREVICMMIVAPMNLQYLSVVDLKTNEQKVVLSPENCSMSKYTHPELPYLQTIAATLKAQLIVLAHQLANN